MALTPRSGFSITTSGQNDIPDEIPNTQADILNNMPFITDTNLNKYAIDSTAYPKTTKMLVGFMKGKRIRVTYYRLLRQGGSNIRTNVADLPQVRNVIRSEYQKITNLEITLPHGFEFEVNNQQASIGLTGEAKFYPNMNPNVGDIFLYGLGDGRLGLFQISSTTPGSWRTDRIYTVKFVLQSFADASDIDPIEGAVTQRHVFDKANYLGGTAALLSEESYLNLAKIKAMRGNLITFFHQSFYDVDISSYLRPDGIYDPFLVQFFINKVTMDDLHIRPKNLTGQNAKVYKASLWARLEDRYNTSIQLLKPQYVAVPYKQTRMGVFVTELYDRHVVLLGGQTLGAVPLQDADGNLIYDSGDIPLYDFDLTALNPDSPYVPYILSNEFYSGIPSAMTAFDLRIYKAVTERTAGDLNSLIADYLATFTALSPMTQFYRIPLYVHLIDMALQQNYREIDAQPMDYSSNGD